MIHPKICWNNVIRGYDHDENNQNMEEINRQLSSQSNRAQ